MEPITKQDLIQAVIEGLEDWSSDVRDEGGQDVSVEHAYGGDNVTAVGAVVQCQGGKSYFISVEEM